MRRSADGLCGLPMPSPTRSDLPVGWHPLEMRAGGAPVSEAHAPGTAERASRLSGVLGRAEAHLLVAPSLA